MVVYNFRSLKAVPTSSQLLDIVLSRTQRKTATEIHKRFSIQRIRSFYMIKVKFTQSTFHERLSEIVDEFPRLDTIHPFYADLINVLYDRDHYKLALGQLNQARTLIDNVAKDYVRLLKFGDSLYRCKLLKRAALGRMATIVKKLKSSLGYLEQVRQHLSRLPSIDPSARTLLLTGYPNAGKSSFINQITRADVDVQPYAFTTKSLFVGHTDYKYLRWQVIDTPGILDHPLEDRNTIEMQSITALAHLNCAILFIVDISGAGQYSIRQQISLFNSIKPLFSNKPLVLVANKTDIRPLDSLDDEDRDLLRSASQDGKIPIIPMSNIAQEGIQCVKSTACDLLLDHRLSTKLRSCKIDVIRNRIQITQPVPRDDKARPICIPESVRKTRALIADGAACAPRKTQRQIEAENGGAGIYNFDMRMHWDLDDAEWLGDVVPEIFNGKNVADYFDADIEERLNALEREEEAIREDTPMYEDESDLDPEQVELAERIQRKKKQLKLAARAVRTVTQPARKREMQTVEQFSAHLESMGIDSTKVAGRGRKRERDTVEPMEMGDGDKTRRVTDRSVSKMRRNRSMTPGKGTAFKDEKVRSKATKQAKVVQRKMNVMGKAGEADRTIRDTKPKWLFSGKRGIGKTDRR